MMQKKTRIFIFITLIFAYFITNFNFGKFYTTQSTQTTQEKVNIEDRIPLLINGYKGEKQDFSEKVYKYISPEEVIIRNYKKGDKQINLAVVISDDRDDLHAPEICYKLQGFEFKQEKTTVIPSSGCKISKVLSVKDGQPYIFHFWYTDMQTVYQNRLDFIKNMMIDKLLNKNKKYALVIMYTDEANLDDLKAYSKEVNNYILKN